MDSLIYQDSYLYQIPLQKFRMPQTHLVSEKFLSLFVFFTENFYMIRDPALPIVDLAASVCPFSLKLPSI